jgi:hypothetical protein
VSALAAARLDVGDAELRLAEATLALGSPDFHRPHVERLLLDALKLVLNALAHIRGLT